MRINTESFKAYYNILSEFYNKGVGDEKTEGIYFNFEDGYAYVHNTMSEIYGRIKFKFEKEDGDKIQNFVVNIKKFLNVAQTTDFILLNNDYVFHTEGSSFKLKILFEDISNVFELFQQSIKYNDSIVFNESKLSELKKANKYLYKKIDFPYRAIYIQQGFISAILSDQVYEAKFDHISNEIVSIYNDFSIFLNLFDNDVSLYINDKFNKIENVTEDVSLIMPKIELPISEIHTDQFIAQYDVPNIIEFKTDELALGLAILSPYYKNSKDRKIALVVKDGKVILKFEEGGEIIKTDVDIVNIEEIDDLTIFIDGDILKKALEILEGTIIRLAINENTNLLYVKSNLDADRKVILSLYTKE